MFFLSKTMNQFFMEKNLFYVAFMLFTIYYLLSYVTLVCLCDLTCGFPRSYRNYEVRRKNAVTEMLVISSLYFYSKVMATTTNFHFYLQ